MVEIKPIYLLSILFIIFMPLYGQEPDSVTAEKDSSLISKKSIVLKDKKPLKQPTMPPLPTLGEKKRSIHLDFRKNYNAKHPDAATNYDALNKPGSYKYEPLYREMIIKPPLPITPLEVPAKPFYNPLPIRDYVIPTRQELDILEVLWTKENVMDTTIYSCLDTTMNVTFEDLNKLLEAMTKKDLVSRRIVSPRNEFNLFGVLIEMSPQNLRNRIYEYCSNVDREMMRRFIDANAYLFKENSSIINQKRLEAARKDSTLLHDLNVKINTPEGLK